jgi:hypothetical protein
VGSEAGILDGPMLALDSTIFVLAFGKNQAGGVLALIGGVLIAAVLLALLLRSRGWRP